MSSSISLGTCYAGVSSTTRKRRLKPMIIGGGTGGQGGEGNRQGGDGGRGYATQIPIGILELKTDWQVGGGTGGGGGKSSSGSGGNGGDGLAPTFAQSFMEELKITEITGSALDISQFCSEYQLSSKIENLLTDAGYETGSGIFCASKQTLLEDKFNKGQIAEVERALIQFNQRTGQV
ncbi:hypothetical protein DFH08DRAFT_856320 [Mycena albidolilacea]|uniref:Uncharacterized protein n=1 Tax=Mycena albidolilacea TaxID=1033008 RepID=A0AAD7AB35_9AGAR|nr:hypothetical protein DFH08DRAFT_856320 [Mycena albidolilacea]